MREFELALPVPDDGPARSLTLRAPADLYIPKVLERDGLAAYEAETMACFLALVQRRGGPIFDIGANIGVFSFVTAAVTDAEVIAFEPTPELAAVARQLAEDNGLHYEVEAIALGAEAGSATFYLSNLTDSSNSLRSGFRPSDRSIDVPVETLDGYVARTGHVPTVLKIDTETTEPDVLRGAQRTIIEHRPWIVCEILARRTEAELEELLAPHGYTWYQITQEGRLVPRRELFGDRTYRFTNWLFLPEPADDDLWASARTWRTALAACTPVVAEEPEPAPEPDPEPAPDPAPPRPTTPPRRRRGVYGRKKMLAGFLTGVGIGASACDVWSRMRR